MSQVSSWLYRISWLLLIPFGQEANYRVFSTSHFFSLSPACPVSHQQIRYTQPLPPGVSRSKSCWLMGATSNTSLIDKQHKRRHQWVHCDTAHADTRNITQNRPWKIVHKTGSGKIKKHYAVGCKYMHIGVNGSQLTIQCTAGVRLHLRARCIPAKNWKPQWSTTAFVHTICEIKHHGVVSFGTFADELRDKHPSQWTKQNIITWEEPTEAYMVEVMA